MKYLLLDCIEIESFESAEWNVGEQTSEIDQPTDTETTSILHMNKEIVWFFDLAALMPLKLHAVRRISKVNESDQEREREWRESAAIILLCIRLLLYEHWRKYVIPNQRQTS